MAADDTDTRGPLTSRPPRGPGIARPPGKGHAASEGTNEPDAGAIGAIVAA